MSDKTKNDFDNRLLESNTPAIPQVSNNPVEDATDDDTGDPIEKPLGLDNDNEDSVKSSKIENPGEKLRKLEEQLSKMEEQFQASPRSKDRANK